MLYLYHLNTNDQVDIVELLNSNIVSMQAVLSDDIVASHIFVTSATIFQFDGWKLLNQMDDNIKSIKFSSALKNGTILIVKRTYKINSSNKYHSVDTYKTVSELVILTKL